MFVFLLSAVDLVAVALDWCSTGCNPIARIRRSRNTASKRETSVVDWAGLLPPSSGCCRLSVDTFVIFSWTLRFAAAATDVGLLDDDAQFSLFFYTFIVLSALCVGVFLGIVFLSVRRRVAATYLIMSVLTETFVFFQLYQVSPVFFFLFAVLLCSMRLTFWLRFRPVSQTCIYSAVLAIVRYEVGNGAVKG